MCFNPNHGEKPLSNQSYKWLNCQDIAQFITYLNFTYKNYGIHVSIHILKRSNPSYTSNTNQKI